MRGVEVLGIKETGPTAAEARLKSKLTGSQVLLIVRTEADAPHRISGIGLRPARRLHSGPGRSSGVNIQPVAIAGQRDPFAFLYTNSDDRTYGGPNDNGHSAANGPTSRAGHNRHFSH